MKFLAALTTFAAVTATVSAASFTYQPSDVDMNDLDHYNPVIWGFNLTGVENALAGGEVIKSVTLSFKNIRNWNNDQNKLFINLIDNPWTDSTATTSKDLKYYGNENAPESKYQLSNYFTTTYQTTGANSGQAVSYLTHYTDSIWGNATENWSYSFTNTQIGTLLDYLSTSAGFQKKYKNSAWIDNTNKPRWDIGLGFDADCHYYNDGVKLVIETEVRHVPDTAATLGLFGTALAALALLRRRQAA